MLGSPQRLCLCDFSSQRQYGDHPPKAIWQPFPHTTHTIPHSHWEQRQDGGGALQLMFPRTPLQAQKMTMTKNLPESWVVRVGSCCWSTGAHLQLPMPPLPPSSCVGDGRHKSLSLFQPFPCTSFSSSWLDQAQVRSRHLGSCNLAWVRGSPLPGH